MFHLRELSLCQKYINTYSLIFQLLILTCILIPINYDFFVLINYLTEWIVIIINIRGQIENRPLQNTRSAGRKRLTVAC